MTIRLCVLLWARPGRAAALASYEDDVLALLADHGGRLVQRARRTPSPGAVGDVHPDEVQLIEFSGRDGLDGFRADARRAAMAARRDAAVARTEVFEVDIL